MSLEHESRSISRSTCSQNRELTTAEAHGFRPSLKNLEKLDNEKKEYVWYLCSLVFLKMFSWHVVKKTIIKIYVFDCLEPDLRLTDVMKTTNQKLNPSYVLTLNMILSLRKSWQSFAIDFLICWPIYDCDKNQTLSFFSLSNFQPLIYGINQLTCYQKHSNQITKKNTLSEQHFHVRD